MFAWNNDYNFPGIIKDKYQRLSVKKESLDH